MVELLGEGSVINLATQSSSYIRVDLDGRCGEAYEALPACSTGLAPAPLYTPATAPAPAPVPYTIHCHITQVEPLP